MKPSLIERARAGTLPGRMSAWEVATLAAFDTAPETLSDDMRWERAKFGHLGRDPVREKWERRIEDACRRGELPFFRDSPAEPRFIERAAFRAWLLDQGIEPSEHVRAWLRPLERVGTVLREGSAPHLSAPDTTRRRSDDIQIEIDDAVRGLKERGEPVTAVRVMALLKDRAGRPDSCIDASVPEGVTWTRGSTGAVEELNTKALHKRIKRPVKVTPSPRR